MAQSLKVKENSATWAASTQSRIPLSRNYHVENYLVKIKVTHDNGATPVFYNEGVFSLINNIQLIGNGNENIKQMPANKLYIDSILRSGKNGGNSLDTTANKTGLTSYVWARINLSMPNSVRPWDTILWTKPFQSLDLMIDWASSANIGSNITVTAAEMTVFSNQLIGYSRAKGEVIKYYEETALKEEVTGTNAQLTFNLPVNKLYRAISIVSTINGLRADTVINSIKLKSGQTVFCDWDAEAFNEHNKETYRIESSTDFKGIYVVDFAERGRLSDMLNTIVAQGGYNTLELVLNVTKQTGSNFVDVYFDTVKQTTATEV
ncbi:MAG: hypothetical protein R3331_02075 [Sulfurospirillaceae bacterium]|nr:hypothetical protein [Sulfurospirillaceae bacterium]